MIRHLLPVLLACASTLPGHGQAQQPPVRLKSLRVSPACTLAQDLGISRIQIAFSRPAVKGRPIWGQLVPFGEVWRTGANAATVLTLSHAARIDGHEVPAGSYAFFAIPGKKTWTLILNRKSDQWGAFDYKEADDILRWQATPDAGPFLEFLDYRILPATMDTATVELGWEKLRVAFKVTFDTKALYWTHLTETLAKAPATDWTPWFQAADYCQKQGIEPEKAMAWIDLSLKAQENFRNLETRARLLRAADRTPEAVAAVRRALELAPAGKASPEWTEGARKELASWTR
jgi:hypothetical protein